MFELNDHPSMAEARTQFALLNGDVENFKPTAKLVRAIFYRNDLLTMFDSFPLITAAIEEFNAKNARQSDRGKVENIGPFAEAASKHASDETKVVAMSTKYAFRHWKALSWFSCLPVSCSHVIRLQSMHACVSTY